MMNRVLPIFLVFCLTTAIAHAQRVETLVKGPSTFDDGLAIDSYGNIYASRYYGSTITKITPSGETNIFSSGFSSPNAIAFDHDGNLLVPNATGRRVDKVYKDGSKTTILNNLFNPTGVVVDSIGNIFVSQYQLSKIVKLDTAGTLTTFLEGGLLKGPVSMLFDEEWNLFIGNFDDGRILKYTSNSGLSIIGDVPGYLGSFTLTDSTIYAAAFQNNRIYKINKDGSSQSIFAGSGQKSSKDGPLLEATFNAPNGIIATNSGDTLFITDFETRSLRMITGLIPNNPKIDIPDTLSFGEVNLNAAQVFEKRLYIENKGNDTLRIDNLIFADSTFSSNSESVQIPPYSGDSLTVIFKPTIIGEVHSTLQLHSNTLSGILNLHLTGIVVGATSINEHVEGPGQIKVFQNYPNPFNPTTHINFEIPRTSDISIRVFNTQGREVALLFDGRISAGSHNLSFNGSNLASGIYYCKIDSKGFSEIIKMTLIK